ncbi:MAG: heterodisulfide reductase-related iron-sulfur binding cluster [Myxococcota bacterium]|jgi:Fe-S oxidoreductase/nitrate reductase gamma subunit|nr:heterodisulfide reductase-related iron-sulfur binding cluster [Myxococcota bacterium]
MLDLGEPTRQIYWNIVGHALIYVFLVAALGLVIWTIHKRVQLWKLGTAEERLDDIPGRVRFALTEIFLQRRQLREPFMGLAHLFIFYGFLAELIATGMISLQEWTGIEYLKGNFYLGYSLFSDSFGILGIIGLLMALWYRGVVKPARFHTIADDWVAVLLLLVIFVQGFFVEGMRIAVTELRVNPELAPWSPGGYVIAKLLQDIDSQVLMEWHRYNWWIHAATAFAFIAYFALGKFKHVLFGTMNLFLRNPEPTGKLNYPDIDELAETDPDALDELGNNRIEQFSWKSLLDLDACVNCGRCESVCPAHNSGVPLSPRKLIQDMKGHLDVVGPALAARAGSASDEASEEAPDGMLGLLLGDGEDGTTPAVLEEELWGCRTCGACMHECPVFIEHIPKIIDMRRYLVMSESKMGEEAQLFLKNLEDRGHPFAGQGRDREEWFEDLDVKVYGRGDESDTLFWVGCAGAMIDRNIETSRAMVKIMQSAGMDFALLGNEEQCTGDPARRVGDELTYQGCTKTNIETFEQYGIKKVVTACPHCFNTVKNEYPDYGSEVEVVHHTELIDSLLKEGKLRPQTKHESVTYHDPCYLGRHNDGYDAPRNVLSNITAPGQLIEMDANKSKSRCCGSGGGYAWMDDKPEKRINHTRIEDVQQCGAGTAAVGCPFCMQMFDDALGAKDPGGKVKAKDIAELVAETLTD